MHIPERLLQRLMLLGLEPSIYATRSRKCVLSRAPLNLEPVPWYRHAYYLPDDFAERKYYFILDPVSIVPCLALEPQQGDAILDMCAAPGAKTFILSFLTGNQAGIVANDIDRARIRRLQNNVARFRLNAAISNMSGRKLAGQYDKILLDAPCSGEGMVNKARKVFATWSEKRVMAFARKQKRLLAHAFGLLAENGILVYSTCTFAPEENEAVVSHLLEQFPDAVVEHIAINGLRHAYGVAEWDGSKFAGQIRQCLRIYPQHNHTSGFFVARIRKR
ncbi:MAG: RsmB/NOP family class I SAM-dependent RNA methyltransferase [Candidatus Aenigmarchaeota archaeon]|nr:RsmB/NOP family class I SAM-dependent RNA methyltransferase [Candidatus Aenigmarchaeota archaeon]